MAMNYDHLMSLKMKDMKFSYSDRETILYALGVGFGRDPKVFMKPGDVIEVEIQDIGTLSNPLVAG